jgi:glycosyltransferase involved in cell wall biosynthesis
MEFCRESFLVIPAGDPRILSSPITHTTPVNALRLDIVVPCFNEAEALPATHRQLSDLMSALRAAGDITADSRIIYVDDGSRDETWSLIRRFAAEGHGTTGLRLSRNCGHQSALLAGLFAAAGDAVISVDADLQDDLAVVPEMLRLFRQGNEVIYGVRRRRDADSAPKRATALLYYRMLRWLGVNIVHNHADYRLLSRNAIRRLGEFTESNLFLRGIVPLLSARTATVEYDRKDRLAGQTKYTVRRMLSLALEGVTSLSPAPLRAVAAIGLLVFFLSVAMTGWVLWLRLFTDKAIPGWASSVIPIYFLGGVQLLSLGVLGEYVARIYLETKRRPRYFIAETTGD